MIILATSKQELANSKNHETKYFPLITNFYLLTSRQEVYA